MKIIKESKEIRDKFTWKNSAKIAYNTLDNFLDNLPDNSPLKNTNLDEINKNLEELNITKNKIVKDIEELLRK